jgi:outer membrane protein OmpA-like peptidoglycan-associated protein
MKPMSAHRTAAAALALAIAIACVCASCSKPAPAPPGQPPPRRISARVTAVPKTVEVTFDGKKIGQTPVSVKVASFDQLVNSFSSADPAATAVEQRITVLSEDEVEVDLVFAAGMSKMAKALNLSKIIVFDYGEGITFDFNKSELNPSFVPLLRKQAEMLKKYFRGVDVHICGHTDSKGTRKRNEELSLDRAKVVYDQLAAMGVPKASMHPQGFASDYPISSNGTPEGMAKNRRIEIILGR